MYEEPKKIPRKKIIEIIILVLIIIWGVFLLINYKRYCDSKKPILMISKTIDYEDGYIKNYIGLFYNIRYYRRNSITKDEMVPFWKPLQNPTSTNGLPIPEKGYKVPDNNRKLDKYRGLLYFYDTSRNLIGTYKCLNGNSTCNKATTGWDTYNIKGNNPFVSDKPKYTIQTINNKYAFIDDSKEQSVEYGNLKYERIIYLYKIDDKNPEILAQYSDIKESTINEDKEYADGYHNKFIVKSRENNKWGLISISDDGSIEEILPFEYDSINYDQDSYLYILCKDNIWSIKDLDRNEIIVENINSVIYDVWKNANQTYYYMIGNEEIIEGSNTITFKVYRQNGTPLIDIPGVTGAYAFPKCVMYIDSKDNKLKFIDYGKEIRYSIDLNFSLMQHDNIIHPAVSIYGEDDYRVRLRIYKSRNQTNEFEYRGVNIDDLSRN